MYSYEIIEAIKEYCNTDTELCLNMLKEMAEISGNKIFKNSLLCEIENICNKNNLCNKCFYPLESKSFMERRSEHFGFPCEEEIWVRHCINCGIIYE